MQRHRGYKKKKKKKNCRKLEVTENLVSCSPVFFPSASSALYLKFLSSVIVRGVG